MIMAEPAEPADLEPAAEPVAEMDLVRRAQRGDLEAYDELIQRYQQRIYATVYHMTSNTRTPTTSRRTRSSRRIRR